MENTQHDNFLESKKKLLFIIEVGLTAEDKMRSIFNRRPVPSRKENNRYTRTKETWDEIAFIINDYLEKKLIENGSAQRKLTAEVYPFGEKTNFIFKGKIEQVVLSKKRKNGKYPLMFISEVSISRAYNSTYAYNPAKTEAGWDTWDKLALFSNAFTNNNIRGFSDWCKKSGNIGALTNAKNPRLKDTETKPQIELKNYTEAIKLDEIYMEIGKHPIWRKYLYEINKLFNEIKLSDKNSPVCITIQGHYGLLKNTFLNNILLKYLLLIKRIEFNIVENINPSMIINSSWEKMDAFIKKSLVKCAGGVLTLNHFYSSSNVATYTIDSIKNFFDYSGYKSTCFVITGLEYQTNSFIEKHSIANKFTKELTIHFKSPTFNILVECFELFCFQKGLDMEEDALILAKKYLEYRKKIKGAKKILMKMEKEIYFNKSEIEFQNIREFQPLYNSLVESLAYQDIFIITQQTIKSCLHFSKTLSEFLLYKEIIKKYLVNKKYKVFWKEINRLIQ